MQKQSALALRVHAKPNKFRFLKFLSRKRGALTQHIFLKFLANYCNDFFLVRGVVSTNFKYKQYLKFLVFVRVALIKIFYTNLFNVLKKTSTLVFNEVSGGFGHSLSTKYVKTLKLHLGGKKVRRKLFFNYLSNFLLRIRKFLYGSANRYSLLCKRLQKYFDSYSILSRFSNLLFRVLTFKQISADRQINKCGIAVALSSCKMRVVARLCGFLNFLTIVPGFFLLQSFTNNKLFGRVRGVICSSARGPLYLEVFDRLRLS